MKIRPDDLDRLSKDDLKALVLRLLAEIEALKDEVARLKGQPGRPKLPPSRMEGGSDDDSRRPGDKRTSKGARRPHNGGPGRSVRTAEVTAHEEKLLTPPDLPSG